MSNQKLPIDIIFEIAMNMSKDDIINLCLTNSAYRDLCKHPSLWKALVFRDFKNVIEADKPSNISWRNFYWYWLDSSSLQNINNKLFNKIVIVLQNRAIKKINEPLDDYLFMDIYMEDGHFIFYKAHSIEECLLSMDRRKLKQLIKNLSQFKGYISIGDVVDLLIDTLTNPDESAEEWIEVHPAP